MLAKVESDQGMVAGRRGRMLAMLRAMLGVDSFSFREKVVLVTGGSRGLGLALTRRLAREGARVAIVARDEDELARAKEDLRRRGQEVMTVKCDVRERTQVQAAVRAVASQLGPVEVLINNAGVLQVGPMETMTLEDFDDAMRTHFSAVLHTTMAVLPEMRRAGEGRIINISSVGGRVAIPHMLPYSVSKFALVGLSEGLREELLRHGIVVTTVSPGLMRTGSVYNAFFKGNHRAEFAWFSILASMPLITMSADRAARLILRASRMGRAQITLGAAARAMSRMHGILPGVVTDRLGLLNGVLPEPDGIGTRRAKGKDSQSRITSSILTLLQRRAAIDLNEIPEPSQLGGGQSGAGQSSAGQPGASPGAGQSGSNP